MTNLFVFGQKRIRVNIALISWCYCFLFLFVDCQQVHIYLHKMLFQVIHCYASVGRAHRRHTVVIVCVCVCVYVSPACFSATTKR